MILNVSKVSHVSFWHYPLLGLGVGWDWVWSKTYHLFRIFSTHIKHPVTLFCFLLYLVFLVLTPVMPRYYMKKMLGNMLVWHNKLWRCSSAPLFLLSPPPSTQAPCPRAHVHECECFAEAGMPRPHGQTQFFPFHSVRLGETEFSQKQHYWEHTGELKKETRNQWSKWECPNFFPVTVCWTHRTWDGEIISDYPDGPNLIAQVFKMESLSQLWSEGNVTTK